MKKKIRTKQSFKKWLCGIMAFAMILPAAVPVPEIRAGTKNARATQGILEVDTSVGWSLGGTSYGTEGLMTINGNVVYCLERLKSYYSGINYTGSEDFSALGFTPSVKEKLSLLAYFGRQRAESSGNVDWHAVTGSAIWAETGQDMGWILSPTFDTDAKLKSAVQTLQNDVAQYYVKPSFQGNTADVKAGETIRLTDANKVLDTYAVKSTDGLTVKIEGSDLVITGTSEARDVSTVTFQKNISQNDLGASVMYDAGDDVQKIGDFKVAEPLSGSITVNVSKHGSLKLAKKDNKGNFVPGTQFKISYNQDMSNPIGTYTTGNDGTVTVTDLNNVNVYIQEVKVPDHLKLDDTVRSVEIKADETVSYTATNDWKQGQVKIVKKDIESGKTVRKAGTVFEIRDEDGTLKDTVTTDESGTAVSKLLDYGTYHVKEAKAPEGYLPDEKTVSCTIDGISSVTIEKADIPIKGQITLEKQGEVSGQERGLCGAVYNITAKENIVDPADGTVLHEKGSIVETLTTDADGKAVSSKLPLGIYEVVEVQAPDGYVLNPESRTVEIKADEDNSQNDGLLKSEVLFHNDITKVEISKQDATTGEELPGAFLRVVDPVQNLVVEEWTSTDEPHVIKGLTNGKEYILIESTAPEGYERADEIRFTVGSDEKVVMKDAPILTDIRVNKVDSVTKKAVLSKDFVFGLYSDKECKNLITKVHAERKKGTATFDDLRYGTYYVKEIKAPKGYELSDEVKKIIINDELKGVGEVHSFTYENILLPASTVQTGDTSTVLPYVISLICGAVGIGLLLKGSRRARKSKIKK